MRLIIYDVECFKHDWIVVFKDHDTQQFTVIHNDSEALKACIDDECIYVGFNSKHYDMYMIKGMVAGLSPEELKKLNDFIIAGN